MKSPRSCLSLLILLKINSNCCLYISIASMDACLSSSFACPQRSSSFSSPPSSCSLRILSCISSSRFRNSASSPPASASIVLELYEPLWSLPPRRHRGDEVYALLLLSSLPESIRTLYLRVAMAFFKEG